jgi:choline dehydrogenase-like flavoprotein
MHVYSPWWLDNKNLDFARGYHIEVWGGLGAPSYGTGFNINSFNKFFGLNKAGGYGNSLRDDMKKYYGSTIGLSGRGESVAQRSNYCEIDPNKVDKYGVPVLRFNYKWTDNEIKQAKHMQDTFEEIIHNMDAIPLWKKPGKDANYGLTKPGQIIHEVGTTRMGSNPKNSVVNEFEQLHDVSNVFVVDAGPFVSQADKNPTWTILALAMRSSEKIIEEFKKQNF